MKHAASSLIYRLTSNFQAAGMSKYNFSDELRDAWLVIGRLCDSMADYEMKPTIWSFLALS